MRFSVPVFWRMAPPFRAVFPVRVVDVIDTTIVVAGVPETGPI
jgi:hypothetical protein